MHPINTKLSAGITTVLFFVLCFCACDKEKTELIIEQQPAAKDGVYAAYTYGYQHINRKATLWNEGLVSDYTNYSVSSGGSNLYIGGVAVSPAGDVYLSGCECLVGSYLYYAGPNEGCHTVLWKNGVKQNLNSKPGNFWFIDENDNYLGINDNGDVFVFGLTGEFKNYTVWKNGEILYNMDNVVRMNDFFVRGNDVYITADSSAGNGKYTLWKNNLPQPIANNGSRVQSIYVSPEGDVYLGLFDGKVLKNNVELTMESLPGEQATDIDDITGYGNDIYVSGKCTNGSYYRSVIWKNGVELYQLTYNKPNSGVGINQIFVQNNDVYAFGEAYYGSNDAAVIWKNGVEYKTLHDDANGGVVDAHTLFVR